jgi:hypothetical protein
MREERSRAEGRRSLGERDKSRLSILIVGQRKQAAFLRTVDGYNMRAKWAKKRMRRLKRKRRKMRQRAN